MTIRTSNHDRAGKTPRLDITAEIHVAPFDREVMKGVLETLGTFTALGFGHGFVRDKLRQPDKRVVACYTSAGSRGWRRPLGVAVYSNGQAGVSEPREGYLHYLVVRPEFRRRADARGNPGVGKYMMGLVLSDMSAAGVRQFCADLTTEPVRALFDSMGIQESDSKVTGRGEGIFTIPSEFCLGKAPEPRRFSSEAMLGAIRRMRRFMRP